MPLQKEYSIVADSTASTSSSPRLDANRSPVIKRATKTYGRRQERTLDEDQPISWNIPSGDDVQNTAPPGLSEEIPATSPHSPQSSLDSDVEVPSHKFEFDWRKKMRDIDAGESLQDSSTSVADNSTSFAFGASSLALPNKSSTTRVDDQTNVVEDDDVFQTSPSRKPSTLAGSSPVQNYILSSPPESVTRPRARKHRFVRDSDSEPEPEPSTTPASAILFQTPNTGSSCTQPTSEDEADLSDNARPSGNSSGAGKGKKAQKVKAPTKKDLRETIKERGRIAAQADSSIAHSEDSKRYSVQALFNKMRGIEKTGPVVETKDDKMQVSDPIDTFSSPAKPRPSLAIKPSVQASSHHATAIVSLSDGSDSEMPPVASLLPKVPKAVRSDLKDFKLKLAQQKNTFALSDDDDDLEIVASKDVKIGHPRSAQKPRISEARKRQEQLAKVSRTSMPERSRAILHDKKELPALLQRKTNLTPAELNQILAAGARKDADESKRVKEEVWTKHGGRLRPTTGEREGGLAGAITGMAEKVLHAVQSWGKSHEDENMEVAETEESDHEWQPEAEGSVSAESDNDQDKENVMADDEEDGENIPPPAMRFRTSIKTRRIANSDSEDEPDENQPLPLRRPSRRTSSPEPTEDENDKENDTKLMYDRGDDKENTAVVCHRPLAQPPLSPSPFTSTISRGLERRLDEEERSPLKEIFGGDEDLFPPTNLTSGLTQSFAERLRQSSPVPSQALPLPTLPAFINTQAKTGILDFSQMDGQVPQPAPLQPAFSELFESETQTTKKVWEDSSFPDRTLVSRKQTVLKKAGSLDLTQDISFDGLQPAFEDAKQMKGAEIFDKEQAALAEVAARDEDLEETKNFYVNDLGFLTQTKPSLLSPGLFSQVGPSQRPSNSQDVSSGSRLPLRTLSYTSSTTLNSPNNSPKPLRRLRKHSTSPPPASISLGAAFALEPTPQKRNAFEVPGKKKDPEDKTHRKLIASEFFENEAAESDEEDGFGFAKRQDEEDEEGEDLDKPLEELVDDQAMDDVTLAENLVRDKYLEQRGQDDEDLEKMHLAAVQGDLRRKRNRGIGVDDSDEESENEENDRARRAMKRLRTSERSDIKDLSANDATRAFADRYNDALKDDEQEFRYLNDINRMDDIIPDDHPHEYEDDEDETMEDPKSRYITQAELRQAIREYSKTDAKPLDPNDTSWMDEEEDDVPTSVTINTRKPALPRVQQFDVDGILGPAAFRKDDQLSASNKQWLLQEHKSRNAGTARSVGGSAVTGHARSSAQTGVNLGRRSAKVNDAPTHSKPVKPAQSMLAVVANKEARFA